MPTKLMGSLRTRNISQIITERIVTSILSGDLKPGEKLPTEDEFAARIGAGKSSVREAIKILEAFGIVEIRRADGTYVVNEFKGAMLDSTVYGILLADRQADDVIDFKVGVQRLAAEDLLAQEAALCAGDVVPAFAEESLARADELCELAAQAELSLADQVANPLIAELYRQAINIARHQQDQLIAELQKQGREDSVIAWCSSYVAALAARNHAEVERLLRRETEALKTLPLLSLA